MDCEMTGLNLERDTLIEVAALVTDPDLNVLGKSGLTEEVRASTVTLAEAEDMVMEYVLSLVPTPRTAPICGNSIATDRGFLARDMRRLDDHLHYRMIDVSAIKELCRRWYPRTYYGQPAKGLAHRALADIKESIRELDYYRNTVFVPGPGPDVEAAKAIAAEIAAARPIG
jgi:oligoribonuclease